MIVTDEQDYTVARFRLRIRRDYAHRDEDQQRVEQQRVRVSRDWVVGVDSDEIFVEADRANAD